MDKMPRVLQILRFVSKGFPNPQEGHFSVEEVNNYLSAYIEKGYRLFSTHYVGENPEAYAFWYILVRE